MSNIIPSQEFIENNYNKTIDIVQKTIKGAKQKKFLDMINHFQERYCFCPASTRAEYFSAFPGGLCYHNLHVLKWLSKLNASMADNRFSNESLATVSLLHEFGKLGDEKEEYYVQTNKTWNIQKGIYYELNPNITFMKIPQRSLYLAQKFEVPLTKQEYMAILLYEGHYSEDNKFYRFKEPGLSKLLYFADSWAISIEHQNAVEIVT